jgi:uncharacterized membrane protein
VPRPAGAAPTPVPDRPYGPEQDQISQNLEAILAFYTREGRKTTRSQRAIERISRLLGTPAYLAGVFLLAAAWMLADAALRRGGHRGFDPPPYFGLQGLLSLGALLTATVVLGKQNRLERLAEQRAHLDLKVTLLTEQKAAKLIDLLEELRRDLPNVRNRHDPDAAALRQSMNPALVLAALDEGSAVAEQLRAGREPAVPDEKPVA